MVLFSCTIKLFLVRTVFGHMLIFLHTCSRRSLHLATFLPLTSLKYIGKDYACYNSDYENTIMVHACLKVCIFVKQSCKF